MSLKEKLAEDLKSSMKNKDTVRKNTVQLVRTAILQVEYVMPKVKGRADGKAVSMIAKSLFN